MISLTDSAVKQLQNLVQGQEDQTKGLRIFVESGGCAGMQYGMTLDHPQEGDEIAERDGVQVLVDPASAQYLKGATIDYADDLAGSGFRIQNPNAIRSCGCGTSFESGEGAEGHTHSETAAH
ncbi:MAG: putative iron binding protein from the HesB IscA SufA family [Chthoniobacteraceae bacterium]|nr:putative iron binding protein from the HesB IscA SufA family [Chthoniobacteraceae bacterium]